MNISNVMNTDVVTTHYDAELAPVVEMMMRRGLESVPVVDHDQALLGHVTRNGLLNPPAASGDSAEEFLGTSQQRGGVTCELDRGFRLDIESTVRVGDVMNRRVVAVRPDSSAREAATLMAEHHLTTLPVISAFGALLGVVTALDLVGQRF
ncbi:MAG: CBS domain-containing protein [Myxococcaceae bacterium]|nr:CBS domain-containing protein [Myxococcaceae bacterium]